MIPFLLQVQKDFDAFKNTPGCYAHNVKTISGSLGLQSPAHLYHTELADYWAGNLPEGNEKIALVELNPQYDKDKIAFENTYKTGSWDHYTDFHNNLFLYYKNKSNGPLSYYQSIASGFSNTTFKNRSHLDFLHENVIRLNIMPYTSVDFNKTSLCVNAEEYLYNRFRDDLLPFMVRNPTIKKAVFHNKQLTAILIKKKFISADHIIYVRMNKGRNHDFIYKKNHKGLDIYIFSRYIPFGGFGKNEVYTNIF